MGAHDHDIADRKLLDRNLFDLPAPANPGGFRRKLGQGLDRALGAAHGIVFQRMAQAEQEQQQRALGEGPQGRRPGRGDEHERVDLETLEPEVVDRLAQREPAPEDVSAQIAGERQPFGRLGRELLDRKANAEQGAADQGEDQFRARPEDAPVGMSVLMAMIVAIVVVRMIVVIGGRQAGGQLRDAEPAEQVPQRLLGDQRAVELDPHRSGRAGLHLQHTRLRRQSIGYGPRPALVRDPRDLPQHVAETPRDTGSRRPDKVLYPGEGQALRVIVDAKLGGGIAGRGHDMHVLDAVATRQLAGQPANAGVGGIRHVREDDRDVELELGRHRSPPLRWP